MASRSLVFRVHCLGLLVLIANLVMAASSYVQVAGLWRKEGAPKAAAFFEQLLGELPLLGRPQTLFTDNWQPIVAYFVPLATVSLACVVLLIQLPRFRDRIDERTIASLYNWAFASIPVLVLAYPVFTQDIWLSAVWGRMAAMGTNPYSVPFTADAVANLPLDHFPMPMSYGPLWAVVSAVVMAFVGTSILGAFLIFKLLLAAAWIGSLMLLRRIGETDSPLDRSLAVVMLGWLPAGVGQTIAEGHNDIAMSCFALLWLYLLLRRKRESADSTRRLCALQIHDGAVVSRRSHPRAPAREPGLDRLFPPHDDPGDSGALRICPVCALVQISRRHPPDQCVALPATARCSAGDRQHARRPCVAVGLSGNSNLSDRRALAVRAHVA